MGTDAERIWWPYGAATGMKKLPIKYETFCREYMKLGPFFLNGQHAAEIAGFKALGARARASQLLAKRNIQDRLSQIQVERERKYEITDERILGELARLAYSNMQDYVTLTAGGEPQTDFSALDRDQWAAVQEITVDETGGSGDGERKAVQRTRFKLADKQRSLETLARHKKLLTDRIEMKIEGDLSNEILVARNAVQKLRAYADDRSRGA
jgi:phage terminase small subunit